MRCLYWAGNMPKFAKHLRTWGEAGIVTTKTDSTTTHRDHRIRYTFVGYTEGYTGDCY